MHVCQVGSVLSTAKGRAGVRSSTMLFIAGATRGLKALADDPLSSGRGKHVGVRWHFIRDLARIGPMIRSRTWIRSGSTLLFHQSRFHSRCSRDVDAL